MTTFQKAQKGWCDLGYLTGPSGNNAIAFESRKQKKIALPAHKHIKNLDEISLGSEKVIEDIDHRGRLLSEPGLAHIYTYIYHHKNNQYTQTLKTTRTPLLQGEAGGGIPILIFDNHNYALYRRLTCFPQTSHIAHIERPSHIIHIDQHSDMNTPDTRLDPDIWNSGGYTHEQIQAYTIHDCQISNFIHPYLKLFPDTQLTWIKSEHQLLEYTGQQEKPLSGGEGLGGGYILDIDIDFRAPQMSITHFERTIQITRSLIAHASLVTIATSPMFIDQAKAIKIVKQLLL